ncbi:hypothetical protein CBR_g7972 [Chara braunii]|uniref:Translation initiation factor IF-3 n=1 Tax=Chara braunii TaxID=69332 RepID=A0A388KKU2_CHABU|nr:hypothetical protein CBR_g7972 [Chara braunii]|eukprot:GBG70671.1 hypothetical protein CBR_g7972 [Chara braunii]
MQFRGQRTSKRGEEDGDRDGPLVNQAIKCPQVRLLDEEQTMVGIVSIMEALARADEAELDLVLIAPDAQPPVARIMDYSKYKYDQEKKKRDMKKKALASRSEQKELKMRYNIDVHDYEVRLRAAQRFLRAGDKVKVSAQFKGREMEFRDLGIKLFERFISDCADDAVVETKVTMEGRTMLMVLAPNKAAIQRAQSKQQGKKEVNPN